MCVQAMLLRNKGTKMNIHDMINECLINYGTTGSFTKTFRGHILNRELSIAKESNCFEVTDVFETIEDFMFDIRPAGEEEATVKRFTVKLILDLI